MYYPELKFFPPVLIVYCDDSEQYPTSVGLLAQGAAYHWYVMPDDEWLNNSYSLSTKEHLTLDYLDQVGDPKDYIFDHISDLTSGYGLLHTFNVPRTTKLLQQINYEDSHSRNEDNIMFKLKNIAALVPERYQKRFSKEMDISTDRERLNPEHADDTCIAAVWTVLRLSGIQQC
ncbi:MAG: hypothetical protein VX318_05050 [Pseudomonadota bacterium]|uniref:hypothetical protein n=1 Tax=Candidatus Enterovibrio escicola TaxID=1927127 RepID=UPI001237D17B|nr:hypothetical protein [Candidatus Enterovibrio escacola]MEE3130012.1 hypothetical protein [Pseudomonadota bacterium]